MNAEQILTREFLELRCKILDLAASFDRLQRAAGTSTVGSVVNDPRMQRLQQGLQLLLNATDNRAEQVQLLFSREYDAAWPKKFELPVER
jgi:hypothetical protein